MNFIKKLFGIKTEESKKQFTTIEIAREYVNKLEQLGYYNYADSINVEKLKADLAESIHKHGVLSAIESEVKPYDPLDYRLYCLDGETLYEKNGILEAIEFMLPSFNRIGIKMVVTNHYEKWERETGLNHSLSLNGKEYVLFKNFKEMGWGEAAQKFSEMINDQLSIHGKEERLYLINGGNDGSAIFLSLPQFAYIDSILTDKKWKPLILADWCEKFEVLPMPL